MTPLRIATTCAVGAVVAWGLKAVAIAVAGGLDRSPSRDRCSSSAWRCCSPPSSAGAGGDGRPEHPGPGGRRPRGVLVGLAVSFLVETGVGALVPESSGWVGEEAGLWATSTLTAVAFGSWYARNRRSGVRSG
ncbi:hypothetical protein [Blastococcus brunescens]|uniref:Integral membrane protein n=1 Tax=Blastococcus brunescens TaxID=1564165 RepID=A0ABZ1B219_9ACTN|nr:hypothetical protein [Blastococcus sp. BMG 8361]WRL64835.1 hypothetical protein U6N30_03565 [Blastococcus sp. BMG 8361]